MSLDKKAQQADEPHGWVTMWPAPDGERKPVYSPGKHRPKYGEALDAKLTIYPVFIKANPGTQQAASKEKQN